MNFNFVVLLVSFELVHRRYLLTSNQNLWLLISCCCDESASFWCNNYSDNIIYLNRRQFLKPTRPNQRPTTKDNGGKRCRKHREELTRNIGSRDKYHKTTLPYVMMLKVVANEVLGPHDSFTWLQYLYNFATIMPLFTTKKIYD